jgi:hypothetical protein
MELDAPLLRQAKIEDLARLAGALGVSMPMRTGNDIVYRRRLISAVLSGIRRDYARAEFERLAELS